MWQKQPKEPLYVMNVESRLPALARTMFCVSCVEYHYGSAPAATPSARNDRFSGFAGDAKKEYVQKLSEISLKHYLAFLLDLKNLIVC